MVDPGAITLIWHRTDAANAGTTLHDPDGFPIQVVQAENPGVELSISVTDIGKTAATFKKVLGFKADGDWFTVPGGSTRIRFTNSDQAALFFRNPGSSVARPRKRAPYGA